MKKISDLEFKEVGKKDKILAGKQLESFVQQMEHWEVTGLGGSESLYKMYRVNNFVSAQKLAQMFGDLAEKYNHHPIISYTWGKLEVYWYTHSLKGIHQNDIFMAQKTEDIACSSKLLKD